MSAFEDDGPSLASVYVAMLSTGVITGRTFETLAEHIKDLEERVERLENPRRRVYR